MVFLTLIFNKLYGKCTKWHFQTCDCFFSNTKVYFNKPSLFFAFTAAFAISSTLQKCTLVYVLHIVFLSIFFYLYIVRGNLHWLMVSKFSILQDLRIIHLHCCALILKDRIGIHCLCVIILSVL